VQHTGLLKPTAAMVAMIDIQQNHFHTVVDGTATLERTVRFLTAARLLEIPVLWTEHYPKAFGPTLPVVADALQGVEPIAKTSFGCFGEPRFVRAVSRLGRKELYLVGSETHICIEQTALVALERGMKVVLVADCLTARAPHDHRYALERMARAGAVVTTWEALVYEWMGKAGHPRFKAILDLVKGA
jgi:nicotinamidase-related amidase